MDDFIKRHRAFLLSLVVLALGVYAAGYAYFYQPYDVAARAVARDLQSLNRQMREARAAAQQAAREQAEAQVDTTQVDRIRSISDFLEHINETARQVNRDNELPKVVLRELSPEAGKQLNYNIEIVVDYFTFLKFTSQLELRDMVINDIEVREYDALEDPPLHLVKFRITPRNDLQYLPQGALRRRAEQMVAAGEMQNLRNPFQQLVGVANVRLIELTNKHRLTFIGRSGERAFASIDRKTYFVGDVLVETDARASTLTAGSKGKRITDINEEERRVYLEEEGDAGLFRYVIGFPEKAS